MILLCMMSVMTSSVFTGCLLIDASKGHPPPAVTSMLLSLIFSSSLFLIPFEPKFACETCWGGGVTTPHAIANFLVTFPLYMEVLDQ